MDGIVAASPWLPLVIFVAELVVVTFGTMRVIFTARGMRYLAPVLGFFEITVWLFAIGQIMQNLTNFGCHIGFAAGFTCGNFLGIFLEKQLALGNLVVRIITPKDAKPLLAGLKAAHFGLTTIAGEGANGPVKIIFTVIQRREQQQVVSLIRRFDPQAFYSVEEVRSAQAGVFPASRPWLRGLVPGFVRKQLAA